MSICIPLNSSCRRTCPLDTLPSTGGAHRCAVDTLLTGLRSTCPSIRRSCETQKQGPLLLLLPPQHLH